MLKLNKEILLKEETVIKIQFDNEWYFDVNSVAAFIKEDLSAVAGITLPFGGNEVIYKKAAKIEDIEAGRKEEELSEFNKALLKAKNFKG